MRLLAAILVSLLVGILATTYAALELGDVVVVETLAVIEDEPRYTRVWYVQDGNKLLLEAGNPENAWVEDLASLNEIRLLGGGLDGRYEFTHHGMGSHAAIRQLMRRKYGWRDWWVSLLFDTQESVMIELHSNDT